MSEEKVTPVPYAKGTPKHMRPLLLGVSYYLVAVLGIFAILIGLYVYYATGILGLPASILSLQPPILNSVTEFFSGIFALVAAFGLRRLAYWGGLSVAVFGVFEYWNSNLLTEMIGFSLSAILGITVTSSLHSTITLILEVLSILVIILSGISLLGIRRHRRVAGQIRG